LWLGVWDQFDLKDFTTPSAPLVTNSFPSDEKVRDRTSPECLCKVISSSHVAGFQIFTALNNFIANGVTVTAPSNRDIYKLGVAMDLIRLFRVRSDKID